MSQVENTYSQTMDDLSQIRVYKFNYSNGKRRGTRVAAVLDFDTFSRGAGELRSLMKRLAPAHKQRLTSRDVVNLKTWDFTVGAYRSFNTSFMSNVTDVTNFCKCIDGDVRDSFTDKSVHCFYHKGKTYVVRFES